jgi:hypothetical protein
MDRVLFAMIPRSGTSEPGNPLSLRGVGSGVSNNENLLIFLANYRPEDPRLPLCNLLGILVFSVGESVLAFAGPKTVIMATEADA